MHDGCTLFDDLPDDSVPRAAADQVVDPGLHRVATWFRRQQRLEQRFSAVLRQSIDEVLDGQRTGRFDIAEAEKTEKTYLGTKVEIVCRSEFDLFRGVSGMDYRIADEDVDAKFSLYGKWMIPREAMGHVCLLMQVNDAKATFDIGLVRIREEILSSGLNRDKKRQLSSSGRGGIEWLVQDGALIENTLLRMSQSMRALIFAESSGQQRVNALFRNVRGSLIDRNSVVTAARQIDSAKRVRDAREALAAQGIVILGHQKDCPRVASELGITVPPKGCWISVRLVATPNPDGRNRVFLEGRHYAVAEYWEPEEPAPKISC
jgi:Restriction endonuclease NaeI